MPLVPDDRLITSEQMAFLQTVDSPTLANAIEKFNVRDRCDGFIGGQIECQFPELGFMVGYALTVTVSNAHGEVAGRSGFWGMYEALEKMPKPAVIVMKDVSGAPHRVAYAGEVMATLAKRLGAVGMVTDGALRDVKEVRELGFHYFMKYPVVSHANFEILEIGIPVEMDGEIINTGDILHGDANGIVVVPAEVAGGLPEAVQTVRETEKRTMDFYKSDKFTLADAKANRGY
jgi:4-hydroxy-4-methyl-2-oxoglutarate aldolase